MVVTLLALLCHCQWSLGHWSSQLTGGRSGRPYSLSSLLSNISQGVCSSRDASYQHCTLLSAGLSSCEVCICKSDVKEKGKHPECSYPFLYLFDKNPNSVIFQVCVFTYNFILTLWVLGYITYEKTS